MEEEIKNVEETKEKKSKNNKPLLIVVLVIFMGFIFGCGMYLGKQLYEGDNSPKKTNDTTPTNTEKQTIPADSKAHSSYVEKGEEYDTKYIPHYYDNGYGVSLSILEDKKTVEIGLTLELTGAAYDLDLGQGSYTKKLTFDREVTQVTLAKFGQAAGGEVILFVMADGTIEYIPLYHEVRKDNFVSLPDSEKLNSYGKVQGVTNVVYVQDLEVNGMSGYYSAEAVRSDKTFYDLIDFIKISG